MGEAPSSQHTLDRKDNNLGYSPENCRWVTKHEQDNNRASNVRFEIDGKKLNVREWSELTGIRYSTLYRRLVVSKWSPQEAISKPIRKQRTGL
jgi:hypothetical protein